MCDPLNISVAGGKWILQYGECGRLFPKDSIFACKTKVSGGQEQEQVFVAMEFTVRVKTYC